MNVSQAIDGKHVCRQELDGGTAYLSASHLTDTGDPAADKEAHMSSSCERITKIKAGSVVHFTEAMIHSGVSVLSERTRCVCLDLPRLAILPDSLDRLRCWL